MNMQKSKIGIVGAGKVGSVLARGLFAQGYQFTGIASNTLESASQLAKKIGRKMERQEPQILWGIQMYYSLQHRIAALEKW